MPSRLKSGAGNSAGADRRPPTSTPLLPFRLFLESRLCLFAVAQIALRDYEGSLCPDNTTEIKAVEDLWTWLDSRKKTIDNIFLEEFLGLYDKKQHSGLVDNPTLFVLRSILLKELGNTPSNREWIQSKKFMTNSAERAEIIALMKKKISSDEIPLAGPSLVRHR